MENKIELKTLRAQNPVTREWKDWPVDEIRVNDTRVGIVHHVENAPICLVRLLSQPTIDAIHAEVRKQRGEQGKPSIADAVSKLPEPEQLKAAMKKKAGIA